MEKLKKDTTYYVGKPYKQGKVYGQAVVFVDSNLKKIIHEIYSAKARDFKKYANPKTIFISAVEFNKLTK
jgi:hypothetical protein